MKPFTPEDHYWIVAGDEDRMWSSAAAGHVPADDVTCVAWREAGGWPTRISSKAELDAVLVAAGLGDLAPHPPKRTVLKSAIISRLIALGKIDAARAALDADAALYARWWAPDRPAINSDDPDALTLLAAIGADPEAVMAE